jgi:hypothetical protein
MLFPRFPPGLGTAFWLAASLISLVELAMHSDQVVHQYRAVFAAGRAMDKIIHIEKQPPKILFIGNSRVDNGIDPKTVARIMSLNHDAGFNLGVPGANLLIYHGMLSRLAQKELLGDAGITTVVIGLDESALQADDSLGYTAFLADRRTLLDDKHYKAWLETWIRLWAYSGNLRQLHEPEKLIRFIQASVSEIEPVGGGAAQHLGYRAGFEGGQNKAQIERQEAGTRQPPDDNVLPYLWRTVELLKQHGVKVYITFLPLLNREPLYLDNALPEAQPYRDVLAGLKARGVQILEPALEQFAAEDFVNAGHLNNRGAQRYSAALGRQLSKVTAH